MNGFVEATMERLGAFGIALLMFLENVFPPIPSELIMPLAGFQAANGTLGIGTVILAGTIGSLLGILPWYYAGLAIGEARFMRLAQRHGRWLTLSPRDVQAANAWFRRRGYPAVLAGRLVPTVRTLISVPAGLARMPFGWFMLFSAVGTALWSSGLALAGYLLGQRYEAVEAYVGPVSDVVVILILLLYIYRVVTFDPGSGIDRTGGDDARPGAGGS